jgi:hypothetical protein
VGLAAPRVAVAAHLALHPGEPDGGGGCPLVSGRCCISNSILKGARQRTAQPFPSDRTGKHNRLLTGELLTTPD